MKNCKDCIHFRVCKDYQNAFEYQQTISGCIVNAVKFQAEDCEFYEEPYCIGNVVFDEEKLKEIVDNKIKELKGGK